ncbi:MAG: tRNA preQ1(34) S-adenosylmethionine ribosyltransferase-isomerase QueA [Bacteroidales bacterium]|nr:tRNA preQ1(34) S-adenosylmethionine ribosyltransferase-isomerase QueA [Bacteroidales bacterium]MDD4669866.1 tRNA preQ1(34) S-adenosylmethionine ribosyltransferase-isomerase QueA [Bacteroidales bacterium]
MKLSQFNFQLPHNLIAKYPSEERDEARLLVLHKQTGEIEHKVFKEVINYFTDKDLFVFNDTKVFPARLRGNKEKTGAEIEVFLLRELNKEQRLWDVLVDPARKIRIGNKLYFGENDALVAEVIDNTTSRGRTLRFLYDGPYEEFKQTLYQLGELPVPKWIRPTEPCDTERFQTIYAKYEGAVASPAAGLHFSKILFKKMEIKGIDTAFLTLHMGNAHFHTVDVEDLSKHKMDSEQMIISAETAQRINKAKHDQKKVVAVGVTVVRALETYVTTKKEIKDYDGWTNKFIFPPYRFSIPDAVITNFHLPLSTMLMNVAAFGGYDNVMNAYKVAIKEGYMFGTYGDAMLVI